MHVQNIPSPYSFKKRTSSVLDRKVFNQIDLENGLASFRLKFISFHIQFYYTIVILNIIISIYFSENPILMCL